MIIVASVVSAAIGHYIVPTQTRPMTLQEMAKTANVENILPGFTLVSATGEKVAHALNCPNCGRATAAILIRYEKVPAGPGWGAYDLDGELVSAIPPPKDIKPQLIARR